MMLERHYDDEALIAILHSGPEAASDHPHLSGCKSCAETLESYRAIAEVLGEDAVWDLREAPEEGAARGVAALRAFAAEMETEDARAHRLVDEMLKSPRQWWTPTVISDERYQNPGVARRLIEVSESRIDTMPSEAVELAAGAIAIADVIDGGEHLLQLRGAAYRQQAYALFYVGDFHRALESVDRAQRIFEQCTISEYALARLDIVRSLIYAQQGRHEDALALGRGAANVFRAFGDNQRLVSARTTEVYLLMQAHHFREALPVLLDVRQRFWADIDLDTRARILNNIGGCQWNLGQINEAVQSLQFSAELFDELGNRPEAARVRENLAALLTANGRYSEARKRLVEVQKEFEALGMPFAAVSVGLELAEIALLQNDYKEVEDLCRAAIREFEAAGVAHSSEALTALTFLREAAEQRRATQEIVWHVKTYIRRLPDEPALLFAPAPLPPA